MERTFSIVRIEKGTDGKITPLMDMGHIFNVGEADYWLRRVMLLDSVKKDDSEYGAWHGIKVKNFDAPTSYAIISEDGTDFYTGTKERTEYWLAPSRIA